MGNLPLLKNNIVSWHSNQTKDVIKQNKRYRGAGVEQIKALLAFTENLCSVPITHMAV